MAAYSKWMSVVVLFHFISGIINLFTVWTFLPICPLSEILFVILGVISFMHLNKGAKRWVVLGVSLLFLSISPLFIESVIAPYIWEDYPIRLPLHWRLSLPHVIVLLLSTLVFGREKRNGILFFVALFIVSQGVVIRLGEVESYTSFYLIIASLFWWWVGKTIDDKDSSVIQNFILAIHMILLINSFSCIIG